MYAVIFRKLFLFDYVPDQFNDDLHLHDDYWDADEKSAEESAKEVEKLFARNKSLKESDPFAEDPETQAFLQQYVRYGKYLALSFSKVLEELKADASKAAWYLTHYTGTDEQMDYFAEHSGPMGMVMMGFA